MRQLLLLVFVLIGVLWWRSRAAGARNAQPPETRASPPPAPQAMRACAVCGLIVPEGEVLRGAHGAAYCCTAHRQQAEPH